MITPEVEELYLEKLNEISSNIDKVIDEIMEKTFPGLSPETLVFRHRILKAGLLIDLTKNQGKELRT